MRRRPSRDPMPLSPLIPCQSLLLGRLYFVGRPFRYFAPNDVLSDIWPIAFASILLSAENKKQFLVIPICFIIRPPFSSSLHSVLDAAFGLARWLHQGLLAGVELLHLFNYETRNKVQRYTLNFRYLRQNLIMSRFSCM
jgi:hypothetical protein